MTTLQHCAAAAVRRDLARATTLLAGIDRLIGYRCRAVCDHLAWLGELGRGERVEVADAGGRLILRAQAFAEKPHQPRRRALVQAVQAYAVAVADGDDWFAPSALGDLDERLPWMFDGLQAPRGRALLPVDRASREGAREQLREYRSRRALLWGTVALHERPVESFR